MAFNALFLNTSFIYLEDFSSFQNLPDLKHLIIKEVVCKQNENYSNSLESKKYVTELLLL